MHPNDRQDRLVSGHPGSKIHMRGKSLRQKHRDRIVRRKEIVRARSVTVLKKAGVLFDEAR
jgi:hypothetical protein